MAGCHGGTRGLGGGRFVQIGTRLSRSATKSRTDSSSYTYTDSNSSTYSSTNITKDCLTEDYSEGHSESGTKSYTNPYIVVHFAFRVFD